MTAPPRPGLLHVENPAIPVHFVRNPRDDNPVKSASRYTADYADQTDEEKRKKC